VTLFYLNRGGCKGENKAPHAASEGGSGNHEKGFRNGHPFFFCRDSLKVFGDEEGVDSSQSGVEAVEVDDGSARQGIEPLEVEWTKVDALFPLGGRKYREAVGPADEGAGPVQEAKTVVQERALTIRGSGLCTGADCRGLFGGKAVQGGSQSDRFHREKGNVAAAAGTARAAGEVCAEFLRDLVAENIHPCQKVPVVVQRWNAGVFRL